jgi:hypothetical protein
MSNLKFQIVGVLVLAAAIVGSSLTYAAGTKDKSKDKAEAKPAAHTEGTGKSNAPHPGPLPKGEGTVRLGGEPDGIVQVANLVYAGTKSSRCFADYFLVKAEQETSISTSRRFHSVKLGSDDIFGFPLLIMTGEGDFQLTDQERQFLRRYIERGGFLLASAGCSSNEWDRAFRREMALVFPKNELREIGMNHPVFHTVYDIPRLEARHGRPRPVVGVTVGGRLGVLYSQDGLNDTEHTTGCCCCGGNELVNAIKINVNVLAYALTY